MRANMVTSGSGPLVEKLVRISDAQPVANDVETWHQACVAGD